MTIEQTTTTDPAAELEELRTKLTIAETENAALRPLRIADTVRAAGFDPASGAGRALVDMIGTASGVSPTKVQEMAAKYGWEPMDPSQIPQRPASPPPTDIDAQIAQAEKDGDWLTAGNLKMRKHQARQQALAPGVDVAQREAITAAEAAGDWLEAGRLKVAAMAGSESAPPTAPTPSNLDAQIAEAEAAGDWGRAGVLKLQRMNAG